MKNESRESVSCILLSRRFRQLLIIMFQGKERKRKERTGEGRKKEKEERKVKREGGRKEEQGKKEK